MKTYYVYLLLYGMSEWADWQQWTPFYVGRCGNPKRRLRDIHYGKIGPQYAIDEILDNGYSIAMFVVGKIETDDEMEADTLKFHWIRQLTPQAAFEDNQQKVRAPIRDMSRAEIESYYKAAQTESVWLV